MWSACCTAAHATPHTYHPEDVYAATHASVAAPAAADHPSALLLSAMAASAGCMAPPRRGPMQTVHAQHATLRVVSGARFVCGTTAQGLGSPRRAPGC